MRILTGILILFCASQLYWAWRARKLARRFLPHRRARILTGAILAALYAFLFAFNFGAFGTTGTPVHLTPAEALLIAPFRWWIATSVVAFVVAMLVAALSATARGARRTAARVHPPAVPYALLPGRRKVLRLAAGAAIGAPFVAGAYGLLYGRLNLETTRRRIRLARLPRAFEGFRIAQLSDIHIGPFMPAGQIRRYVAIANELKPDLILLTGDFVTWDADTQEEAVAALSGLQAPFGVFGCLGNHDAWAGVEDSITALFQAVNVRILRQARVSITAAGEALNLLGVDFQSRHGMGPSAPVPHVLRSVEPLVTKDSVNILLSHNPDTFDRAAQLGIDLSLAGHTHGGQVALEFISPEIAPSRLVTPYVSGWFEKPGGQLYVNRGIGTIGVPIRLGAPPEITMLELTRNGGGSHSSRVFRCPRMEA